MMTGSEIRQKFLAYFQVDGIACGTGLSFKNIGKSLIITHTYHHTFSFLV